MTTLHPATGTSHWIEANGVKLHYLDYGEAGRAPIVCVHGAAAHAHWFDFAAPGLTPEYHVRSLDLRGHGDSAWAPQQTYSVATFAADLHAFVEHLHLHDFILIGHSMGGMVSLFYAANHPGRVAKLIIVDSIMLMPMERIRMMRAFGETHPRSYASQEALIERYRLNPPDTHIAAPEVIHHMAINSGRQGSDGRWQHKADRRVYANSEQVDGMPLWERITIPALVIRGSRSTRFRAAEMTAIHARAPQVAMAEVAAANHHIPLDNPGGFVEAVQGFLRR